MKEKKQLPKNWITVEIEKIGRVLSGSGFPKKFQGSSNGKYPFFKVGDISRNVRIGKTYLEESENSIDEDVRRTIKAKVLPKNSIVFAKIGEALRLNRRGILNQDSIVDNNAIGIESDDEVLDYKLLFYYLKTLDLSEYSAGNAVPSVRKSTIESILLPLPPRPEQDRIVAKVDILMAQVESMQKSLARIPQLLKDFRQQVLTQAFTGKLTEEWREGKELSNWQEKNARKIFDFITSGSRGWAKYYDDTGEQLFVRITNLNYQTYKLDLSEEKLRRIRLPESSEGKRTLLRPRDVLISITADVGMIALIEEDFEYEGYVNQHICLARPKKNINEKFLCLFLMSQEGLGQFESKKRGATKAGLTLGDIKTLEIKSPPFEEQHEIVCRVESLLSKADAIESQYQSLKAKTDTLPQAILHKAFKGELVPQLASDGDARELLKNIETLKAAGSKKAKTKSKK